MDKAQKIKQEIERRIDLYSIAEKDDSTFARMGELSSLMDFIDSLPKEPASGNLEEEIENYIKDSLAIKFPTTDKEQIKADIRYIARHFAEWQKQKDLQDFLEKAEEFFNDMYDTMGKPALGKKTIELFKNYMQDEM